MTGSDSFQLVINHLAKEFTDVKDTFALFGLYYTGRLAFKCLSNVLYGFKTYVVSSVISNEKWLQSQGGWAVVTGSTHGIGLAYAAELAKRKINLILVARNKDYLDKVANSFQEKYNVQVITVVVDLSDFGKFHLIEKAISDKDIGILVNNAGLIARIGYFHNNSTDEINGVIDVNTKALVHMTRMVLPQMIKKNKGIIVNLSSSMPDLHPGLNSMYASTKSFVNCFSEALQYEYKDTNIYIQCLVPQFVQSQMSIGEYGNTARSLGTNATDYAAGAVKTLGYSKFTTGYWKHGLNVAMTSLLPKSVVQYVWLSLMNKELRNAKTTPIETRRFDDSDKILN